MHTTANPRPPIMISRIDRSASVALTQSVGECVVAIHGLHIVFRGASHCRKCGAR
jgi:hypothetical protein